MDKTEIVITGRMELRGCQEERKNPMEIAVLIKPKRGHEASIVTFT